MMKRPFAVVGITYLLSQAVAAYLGTAFSLITAIVFAVAAILYSLFEEKRSAAVIAVIVTVCFAMTVSFAYTKLYVESAVSLEGQMVTVSGRVVEEPYKQYGRYYYVIKTDNIYADNVHKNLKIRVSSTVPLNMRYSDRFSGAVTFTSIRNENSFASHRQLLSKGIIATAYVPQDSSYTVESGSGGFYGLAILIRNAMKDTIGDLYPDETGDILIGMLTGDESRVDSDIISAFRDTGLAHVLAVSGLHMTLLAAAVTWILRRFFLSRKIIAVIVCAIVWFYAAIAGFPLSSIRAAIMITVMLLGILLDRQHTPLNSMGLALFIICLANPYACINAGLLMSFSATFGLLAAAPEINRHFQRVLFKDRLGIIIGIMRNAVSALLTAFTASLFILPASVLYFGKISLLSPIANFLIVPFAEVFLALGMITVFLGFFGSIGRFIAYFFMTAGWFIGKIILKAVEFLDNIPGAELNTGSNTSLVVFGCILVGIIWALLFRNSKHRKRALAAAALCCVVISFVWFCSERILTDASSVKVYSVGDSVIVLARDRSSTVLVGAGGDSYDVSMAQYDILDDGISEVTALVLTDLSQSGAACADSIIENMNPCEVLAPERGFYYDYVEYYTDKYSVPLSPAEGRSVSAGEVTVSSLADREGLLWSLVECGSIKVIICPESGNCMYCPFGYSFDAVVMTADVPGCLTAFEAKTYIICSEYEDGSNVISQLMSRGLENIYCTGKDGNIELSVRDGRLYIGSEN